MKPKVNGYNGVPTRAKLKHIGRRPVKIREVLLPKRQVVLGMAYLPTKVLVVER